ncbi:hypothetical protein MCERE85_00511 [Candidatus Nanopelagicaceae bacterium]
MPKKPLPNWLFGEVPSGTKNRNPVQDEFFNSSEALTEISSLVRESIQNSLDAHESNISAPVKLKFKISEISRDVSDNYFQGLEDHVTHGIPGGNNLLAGDACKFLIVEDFNTTGLLGDSRKDQLAQGDIPSLNSYHYFVWAEGSSAKIEGNRGRWGIGKIVFPRLSSIKTFFVLSKRSSVYAPCGQEEILIGMSTLRGHSISGKNYQPDGWWSDFSAENHVPIPVNRDTLTLFKNDWNVQRNLENGLSILIPYIPDFITSELIRDCVIRDYFIAIIQGLLEVEITDDNLTYLLNKDNLRKECESLGADERIANSKSKEEMLHLIDMVLNIEKGSNYNITVDIAQEFPNKWSSISLEAKLAEMATNLLDSGETVVCKVNAEIPLKSGVKTVDSFDVYLKKVPDARTSAVFSREGIVIPSANPTLLRDHLALVIAKNGPLANMLADAEGPAHEKWSEKTDKFRSNYVINRGGQLLTFVRKSPSELIFKVRGAGTERDSTAFSSFFPLPGSKTLGKSGETLKKQGDGERPPLPVSVKIEKSEKRFEIDESPNGFSIKSVSDNPALVGKKIHGHVAYKVRSGDSFLKWQIEDFDLSTKKPRLDGCILLESKGNQLILEITGRKFKAIWSQFDPIRDLDVKADFTESLELK